MLTLADGDRHVSGCGVYLLGTNLMLDLNFGESDSRDLQHDMHDLHGQSCNITV